MSPPQIGRTEFIALMAMLFATIAFTIDAMLPALPEMGAELSPDNINKIQLVITSFMLGMGAGTFIVGPLADAYGRRPILLAGAVLYCAGSVLGGLGDSLEMLLLARFAQGVGAAGPRVVGMAVVRDLFRGREMARITSFVIMVFSIVPALAPTLGAIIVALSGWRMIFASFVVFSLISAVWYGLRLPETLAVDKRKPLSVGNIRSAIKEVFSIPMVRLSIAAQSLCLATLFSTLSSTQQIMDVTFGEEEHFHLWFGLVAMIVLPTSMLNAKFVVELGMRRMVTYAIMLQVAMSAFAIVILLSGGLPAPFGFTHYIFWKITIFFMVGLTLGNLTALSMEPLGHIAGLAGSVIVSVSTVSAVAIAVPVGLAFDGTPLPLAMGVFGCTFIALVIVRKMARLERVVVKPTDH